MHARAKIAATIPAATQAAVRGFINPAARPLRCRFLIRAVSPQHTAQDHRAIRLRPPATMAR